MIVYKSNPGLRSEEHMNAEKLLKLADILDAAHEAHQRKGGPGYNQARYTHECGTPACALGHWAAAHPERFAAILRESPHISPLYLAELEFDLTHEQASELFDADGCGEATTHKQAAEYIRDFVARNTP